MMTAIRTNVRRMKRTMSRFSTRVLPWLRKSIWTVLDQGLFASSNFVLNILLARWLIPEEYGAFTVAFTVFLLLGTLHTGLLTEPMLVFGPSRYDKRLPEYLGVLLRGHAGFAMLSGLGLGIGGLCFLYAGSSEFAGALLILAATQPFLLFLWLARRACYVRLKPQLAATAGMLYAPLLLLATYGLYETSRLSMYTALAAMAITSIVAGGWILFRLSVRPFARTPNAITKETARRHWEYGRWAVATNALNWLPGGFFFLILPVWGGLEANAVLKALTNLVVPVTHVYAALSVLLIPVLVKKKASRGFYRLVTALLVLVVLGTSLYWVLLGLWGAPVMAWLYDHQYTDHAHLLWLVGCLPVVSGVIAILATALRALERPDGVFWGELGSATTTVVGGTALVFAFGVTGAIWGNLLAMVVNGMLMTWLLFGGRETTVRSLFSIPVVAEKLTTTKQSEVLK